MKYVLVVLLFAGCVLGEDQPAQNGFWWSEFKQQDKNMFVYGYITAMASAQFSLSLSCQTQLLTSIKSPAPDASQQAEETCNARKEVQDLNFTGVRVGQVSAGLDQFYSDFRNKNITVGLALQYVKDQIKGKSVQELEPSLLLWRRWASQ